jgi:hypothetical protein
MRQRASQRNEQFASTTTCHSLSGAKQATCIWETWELCEDHASSLSLISPYPSLTQMHLRTIYLNHMTTLD